MAPRFKRKRQASHTSSSASPSRSWASHRGRFKRPSVPSQLSSQSRHNGSSQSQPASRHHVPENLHHSQAQPRHVADNDDVDEDLEQVVMAIDRQNKRGIGCAYYVARDEKLYCLQDVTNGTMEAIEKLKLDVQPTIILLSSRVDPEDNDSGGAGRLRHGSLVDDVGDDRPLPYQVDIRPSQEFSYEGGKTKLINIESTIAHNDVATFLVPGEASTYEDEQDHENFGSTNRQGKLLRLSSWIDFENQIGIGCMGAVLTHLQRRRAAGYLPDDPNAQWAFRVRSLEMVTVQDTMFVGPDTLLALQIIQPESHPNAFNQGPGSTGSKESLSLYGLFHHYARSPQGKARLRQIFLRPSLQLEDLNARLDFISLFVRPENLIPLQKLSKSMGAVKNIRTIMTHLHKGINGGNQKFGGFRSGVWATLLEFAYHTIDIRDTLREVLGGERLPLLTKAMGVLETRSLQNVGRSINDVVDRECSIEQNRTVVKRGVNDHLDDLKNVYDGMDDLLSRTAVDIARHLPDGIAIQLNVIYFPQLGYHITVPINPLTGHPVYEGDPDDAVGGGRWERMFTTENQVYFKDARMREMDERLGDLWNMICDIEVEISYDLAQRVLQHEEMLIVVSDLCGELDCMFALAQGANQYNLVRPRITEENTIDIKNVRHLLQEMTVPSYVTNDAFLVGGKGSDHDADELERLQRPASVSSASAITQNSFSTTEAELEAEADSQSPSMLLLTGPNYSGKSVYLKSVAQCVYLSHLGSFVPCTSALIGLTDALLTRIRTCETVSRPHSAFMIDLQQVAMVLKMATRRSLVVIDEFGKGTNACDGAGLVAGVLRHLLGRGVDKPKVLAATHFYEIFEMGGLGMQKGLACKHMEVRVDRRSRRRGSDGQSEVGGDGTEVTYLYNLRPGRSSESFGTQCAAMNGVPMPIVERASQLSRLAVQGEDLVRICAGLGREEEEDLERAEAVARRFLEWDVDEDGGGGGQEDPRRLLEGWLGEGEVETEMGHGMGTGTETETNTRSGSRS